MANVRKGLGCGCLSMLLVVALLALLGDIAKDARGPATPAPTRMATPAPPPAAPDRAVTPPGVSMDNYNKITDGMTHAEVSAILGGPGEEISRSSLGGVETVMYQWKGAGLANMNAMFQDGRLITKAQFGLK